MKDQIMNETSTGIFKKLVISPHVDDEVLGCGGILDKNTYVYFCGIDESKVAPDPLHRIPLVDREQELNDVADFFEFSYEVNKTSSVNYYVIQTMIAEIERIINKIKPAVIFIPHSGYNQDHKVIFDACQVALRPHDKNFFVSKVLVYEAIHDFIWSWDTFVPNYFIDIDIEKKNKGYAFHKSQIRGMRSFEMLKAHARIRGAMCNAEYAEAYYIQRWVEKIL